MVEELILMLSKYHYRNQPLWMFSVVVMAISSYYCRSYTCFCLCLHYLLLVLMLSYRAFGSLEETQSIFLCRDMISLMEIWYQHQLNILRFLVRISIGDLQLGLLSQRWHLGITLRTLLDSLFLLSFHLLSFAFLMWVVALLLRRSLLVHLDLIHYRLSIKS